MELQVKRCRVALAGLCAIACLGPRAFAQNVNVGQHNLTVMKTIARQEGDARLDYASIDIAARRLYVARGFGVTAIDLDSERAARLDLRGVREHGCERGGGL